MSGISHGYGGRGGRWGPCAHLRFNVRRRLPARGARLPAVLADPPRRVRAARAPLPPPFRSCHFKKKQRTLATRGLLVWSSPPANPQNLRTEIHTILERGLHCGPDKSTNRVFQWRDSGYQGLCMCVVADRALSRNDSGAGGGGVFVFQTLVPSGAVAPPFTRGVPTPMEGRPLAAYAGRKVKANGKFNPLAGHADNFRTEDGYVLKALPSGGRLEGKFRCNLLAAHMTLEDEALLSPS